MSDPKAQTTAEPTMEEILASIRRIISENDEDQDAKKQEEPTSPAPQAEAPAPPPPPPKLEPKPEPAPAPKVEPAPAPEPEPMPAAASAAVLELTEMVTDDGSVVSLSEAAAEVTVNTENLVQQEPVIAETSEDTVGEDTQTSDEHAGKAEIAMENLKNDSVEFASEKDTSTLEEGLVSAAAASAATANFAQLARSMAQEPSATGNMPLGSTNRTLEDLIKEMVRPMLKDWLDRNLPQMVEHMVRRELDRMTRKAEGL